MLISTNINSSSRVKFISYTGRYPNLCRGILTLEIDGKQYKCGGGNSSDVEEFWRPSEEYPSEWEINVDKIPPQFKELAFEIDDVFNENVEWGHCGGCR
jgi:hypothetical protein